MNDKVNKLVEWAKLKDNPGDCSVCDCEPEGCPGCGTAAFESGLGAGRKDVVEWVTCQGGIMEFIDMYIDEEWRVKLKEWEIGS